MNAKTLRTLHRWLGVVFSLFVLIAAGSGVIHNIMSWTQPPPPKAQPAGQINPEKVTITPNQAIERLGSVSLTTLALREIAGEPWYQCYVTRQPVPQYVSATDGTVSPEMDERYAAEIASRFLGGVAVRKTNYLTEFDREYIVIYRILPVYRFDADDELGTRVYVSTMTGSVTRHTDNHRQLDSTIFSLFHKFAFIPDKNWRNGILTFVTAGIALTALVGLLLFLWPMRRRSPAS